MYIKNKNNREDTVDLTKLSDSDLSDDIFNEQNESLLWYLEELCMVTDNLNTNISDEQKIKLEKIADMLIPYFKEFLNNENKKIREFCELGLEQVLKMFPEILEKFKSN